MATETRRTAARGWARRAGAALLVAGLLGGCMNVDRLADTLNKRNITSCIWAVGSYGPFVGVQLLSATGGASLDTCMDARRH